jgi:hypothetical protein
MKKLALSIVWILALSVAAIPVGAQTRSRTFARTNPTYERRYDGVNSRVYNNHVYGSGNYRYDGYNNADNYYNGYYDDRSTWERSRDKITTAVGAGAGAAVGAAIGGKQGALIGAIAGGGGAALYTYVLRDKNNYRY